MLVIFFLFASALVFTEENKGESIVSVCSYIIILIFFACIILSVINIVRIRILNRRRENLETASIF